MRGQHQCVVEAELPPVVPPCVAVGPGPVLGFAPRRASHRSRRASQNGTCLLSVVLEGLEWVWVGVHRLLHDIVACGWAGLVLLGAFSALLGGWWSRCVGYWGIGVGNG